jgi:processive 1,2-diacylglycerol beta-glucosyltransferase
MTRILVLSVSAGAGHVRAAEALVLAAQARGVVAEQLDVLDLVPDAFRKLYSDTYLKLVERHPRLWAWLYEATDTTPPDAWFARMRRGVERLNTLRLRAAIDAFAPDRILCTHFLPAELLARRIARGDRLPPVWVQVTDFDLHRLWVHPGLAGYLVANDEIALRVREALAASVDVHAVGIPIHPRFAQPVSRAESAAELGIDPQRTTVLVMTGGAGIGSGQALVERLLSVASNAQIVALAGRNDSLLAEYQRLASTAGGRLFPLGFTRTIERVMCCADIAVTKPGGLSTSECLAMGLPMVLVAPIPGQEERNAEHLLEQGAALLARDTTALAYRVGALLADPSRRQALVERAKAIARPAAATHAIGHVLGAGR